ncbi:MAG TPA: efflux RND transporter periplasmic adaptor subunit [Polyangiaceae bacterium]
MIPPKRPGVPGVILAGAGVLLGVGALMIARAEARTNKIALASSPQPVAVVRAAAAMYRPSRAYGGTLASWVEARVGPQLLSAYIETVLVRPGAVVHRGDVLATLDCRNASASTLAVRMEARAIATRQRAVADEASRFRSMLDGGFVSSVEVEQGTARGTAEEADLEARQARLEQASIAEDDCVLRAPFDGEIATRSLDPGAFVRPGASVLTIVDRATVRFVADAPETDFDLLRPGTPVRVRVYATSKDVPGVVARRAPGTDLQTRTVRFEVDVPDPDRDIPTNTTGEAHIDAGEPVPATEVPLYAATVRAGRAALFVVEGDGARAAVHPRSFEVKGEIGGSLFLDTSLPAGTRVVLEGRELLEDGDLVATREATEVRR